MHFLSHELSQVNLAFYMREALLEAERAGQEGELPIGAVLVIEGEIISRGRARQKSMRNQLRHAELNALLEGGERLWHDYEKAILFTSVEPCPLCLGAAVMADIPHLIFALPDQVVCTAQTVELNPYIRRHIHSYFGGVLAEESAGILARYDPDALSYMQKGGYEGMINEKTG
jgi:tRNA(adenine34) deaminase